MFGRRRQSWEWVGGAIRECAGPEAGEGAARSPVVRVLLRAGRVLALRSESSSARSTAGAKRWLISASTSGMREVPPVRHTISTSAWLTSARGQRAIECVEDALEGPLGA